MGLEEESDEKVGWYYLDGLRHVAELGRWPDSLSRMERRHLKRIGYVKVSMAKKKHVGPQPSLTEKGLAFILNALKR